MTADSVSATPVDDEKPLDDQGNDKDMAMITTKGPKKELTLGDELLPVLDDDPRNKENAERQRVGQKSGGRNTESFDPKSTLVRPEMRIVVGPNQESYGKSLKHDDVLIVPEFFCKEDDWTLYYKLIEEMRGVQATGSKQSEWISWHEGAHLITKNPADSPTFNMIQNKIAAYFNIAQKSVGTRFNWYRDSSDWKPFHHDSAAFNPQRAKNQNITVGVSFGSTRELAFIHAENKTKIYFPQTNGMMFSFGRDVNITWKHGVNALHEKDQDGKGRVSIILWGLCPDVTEEDNSPRMISNERNFGGKGNPGRGNRAHRDRDRDILRDRRNYEINGHRTGRDDRRGRSRSRDYRRERSEDHSRERGKSPGRSGGYRREGGHGNRSSRGDLNYPRAPVECRDFRNGHCRYGSSCKFSH